MAGTQVLTHDDVVGQFASLENRLKEYDKRNKETFGNLEANLRTDSNKLMARIKTIEDKQEAHDTTLVDVTKGVQEVKDKYDLNVYPVVTADIPTKVTQQAHAF